MLNRKISELLNPETFKTNLVLSSVYIAYFESTIDYIKEQPFLFHCDSYERNKGWIANDRYKKDVLNLDKNKLKASLLWFVKKGAIQESDILQFDVLRKYRNKLAHELPKIIFEEGIDDKEYIENISKLFELRIRIEKWWFFNFEIHFIDNINENVTEEEVITGGQIMFKLFSDILSDNYEEANFYSENFKKYFL